MFYEALPYVYEALPYVSIACLVMPPHPVVRFQIRFNTKNCKPEFWCFITSSSSIKLFEIDTKNRKPEFGYFITSSSSFKLLEIDVGCIASYKLKILSLWEILLLIHNKPARKNLCWE